MTTPTTIATRLAAVQEAIDAAVARRGPGPAVRLVGVSKRQPMAALQEAAAAGLRDFGENYAQEFAEKSQAETHPDWRWHFIGAVQRNKVRHVVGCTLLHTIDRPALLTAVERRAAQEEVQQEVLVQVNVADEAGKSGVAVADLPDLLDRFADLDHVRCRGLMLIPPLGSPEHTRAVFRTLRLLAERHAAIRRPNVDLTELSMGMSADFGVAIEEGATIVRVGTAVFGPRPADHKP